MSSATPPVVFENIVKRYGAQHALDSLSLILPGEATTAVIGPSGSGKSTLVQLINGLISADDGRLRVFGKTIDRSRLHELRRKIGYAVQGTGLFPHITVEQNIALLARLERWPAQTQEERVHELMTLVGLPIDFLRKHPFELSGGEQQRVGLCRAMMLDPPLFLLDEPFGALDPITRTEIHAEFIKLQRLQARTIVLVTHDLREALKLADFIVLLNKGKLEQIAARDDILKQPASAFVEKFVHMQLDDGGSPASEAGGMKWT